MVKRFLLSSSKLQEKSSERDLATENIRSNDSTTFAVLLGSNTNAISEEVFSSRKLPGFLAFIRLNHIESESQRLRKTSYIQKEEIRIIFWILRNIETKIFQKIKIISRLAYLFLKIILYHFT